MYRSRAPANAGLLLRLPGRPAAMRITGMLAVDGSGFEGLASLGVEEAEATGLDGDPRRVAGF
jgi:hypothetical protein